MGPNTPTDPTTPTAGDVSERVEKNHLWLPVDIEGEPGEDVAVVTFSCVRCGFGWRTYTSLTMPADYEDACG